VNNLRLKMLSPQFFDRNESSWIFVAGVGCISLLTHTWLAFTPEKSHSRCSQKLMQSLYVHTLVRQPLLNLLNSLRLCISRLLWIYVRTQCTNVNWNRLKRVSCSSNTHL
jgi:hypothetical protein